MTCIFCQIIKGVEPAHRVYEDESVVAFLDRRPVREGTTLVVPKTHYGHFIDMPDELTAQIVRAANKIGRKISK